MGATVLRRPFLAVLVAGLAIATVVAAAAPVGAQAPLEATIRRTAHGIPHISASDYGGIGYGYGYVSAQDNVCILADEYVTVRAQRSLHFGPDEGYVIEGNGASVDNLNSDFFWQRIIDSRVVEELLDQPPPHGPLPGIREGVRGYVAGYNRYLTDAGPGGITDPRCAGAPWVTPITEMDVYRYFYGLILLASQGVAVNEIASAQPPPPGGSASMPAPDVAAAQLAEAWDLPIGSNAVALGSEATASGRGMILGNPHFPWDGAQRFYQTHLTIPGQIDVQGGSLLGLPIINIGNTTTVGWSHTVSTAFRFTPFQLTLVPGSPTTYLVDGQPREMATTEVTVQARTEDGSVEERSRTLYSTEYGPMLNGILGLPIFPWTPTTAFAMADANATNFRALNHFFEVNQAETVRDVHDILLRDQGIPWVNTIAADANGEAYYADISVVPNVPDSHAQQCNTAMGQATFEALRLPVLDGSRASCAWLSDPDAAIEGIFGPSNLPHLFRRDYVTNANDSYWLSNPEAPLEGFALIIGDERTARTTRTRSGLVMVEERLAGTDGAAGTTYTLEQLQEMLQANRQHAAELTIEDLIAMCESFPGGQAPSAAGPTDVSGACPVLAAWDLRDDVSSRGALLFRRFWERAQDANPDPWAEGFDASDPVHTPRGLDTTNPQVQQALGDAVNDLESSGIPLDAPLGDWQYELRGDERIPIHGGPGVDGVFNAINVDWRAGEGYPDIDHGSSYIQAIEFTEGCPEIRTILTYSQSSDPTSPYWADQTRLFSDEQWVDVPFCEADIAADPALRTTVISEGTPAPPQATVPAAAPAAAPAPSGALPATGNALPWIVSAGLAAALLLRPRSGRRRWR